MRKSSTKSTDKEEQEANGFAIELLTGDSNTRFTVQIRPSMQSSLQHRQNQLETVSKLILVLLP